MRYVHIWTDGNGEIGFDTPKFRRNLMMPMLDHRILKVSGLINIKEMLF